jgi:hypothetical protein
MKRYSQLTATQKANFKSFCVAQRFAIYGSYGFVGQLWHAMTVDGVIMDRPLFPYQFNRPYKMGDITGKNGSIIKTN